MATSGAVGIFNQTYTVQNVLDHAFRRAGFQPENIAAEQIQIAIELLFTLTSEWVNAGFPLWTREFFLLGPTIGSPDAPCPLGTVDCLHTYWRLLNPYRGPATGTDGTNAANLFGGQVSADVTIAGPNPGVIVNFGTATEVDTVGVLLGTTTSLTAALTLLTSPDGVTWTTFETLPSATYSAGQWVYFDLDPSITAQYLQIQAPISGSWTLNQLQFALANGEDIMIGPLNIDDYYNLPTKAFQGDQSVSAYVDRQLNFPVIKLWPTPNVYAFYNACVSVLARRYIQDPGDMVNNLEVPQRWIEATQWRLAVRLMDELPEPKVDASAGYGGIIGVQQRQQRYTRCEQNATKAEALAWAEERNTSPIRLTPNIAPYTR